MITWVLKDFHSLSSDELYAILRLRTEVFVVEQNCVFQDLDNKDQHCLHLMGWKNDLLAAYTRLVPAGVSYEQNSIGRVVIAPSARRGGLGKTLMEKSIEEVNNQFGTGPIKIGAQLYLKEFYESLGFKQSGNMYDEDGIDHIHMIRG